MIRNIFTLLFMLVVATTASADPTRLVVHIDQEDSGRTHLVGSPFQIMISIVNSRIEEIEEAELRDWRQASTQLRGLPKPTPIEVTPELRIDLGEHTLSWFETVDVRVTRVDDGSEWLAATDWAGQLSFPFQTGNERVELGRDPIWVTLEVTPEMAESLRPGRYAVTATSPFGTDAWEFKVRAPADEQDLRARAHRRAKWELAEGSPDLALEFAQRTAPSLESADPEYLLTRGRIFADLGRIEPALGDLNLFLTQWGDSEKPCFLVESARRLRNELLSQIEED